MLTLDSNPVQRMIRFGFGRRAQFAALPNQMVVSRDAEQQISVLETHRTTTNAVGGSR